MPDKLFDLSTGVNTDTLFNVKLDTQERMKDLYEGFNVPAYKSPFNFVPKTYATDDILKGDVKLPTVEEALDSDNPDVVNAALDRVKQKAQQNPGYRGVGYNNMVKYQEGQNKFTEDHWWKENNQTMYGFNPYKSVAENEDFLHHQLWDNYSLLGKTWRGVGTFAGRTLSKLVTGLVGTVGDLGAMTWNGLQELGDLITQPDVKDRNNFWDDVSNNYLSRKMQEADDWTKNHILPTYKAIDYDNKGAWSKLFDPYTWTNSFADGAGFLLQFAVPGAVFGRAAQAGKIAASIGELTTLEELAASGVQGAKIAAKIEKAGMTLEQAKNVGMFNKLMGLEISNASAFGKHAGNVSEFLTGSKDVGGITAHIFNTSMEAVSETKEGFNNTVRDLMDKGMSRNEAVQIAGENAPGQFWVNMGILTASNAFENKLLQKAIGNRGFKGLDKLDDATLLRVPEPTTKLGKFFESNSWGNRIKFYGQNAIKASVMEGYWEENAQTAAQRWASGEYTRQGDDTGENGKREITQKGLTGFFKQLYKQTIDSAKGNDREAADSIMAGAVIGVIGGTAFAKISGERKSEIKSNAELIASNRNTRDAWLSLNTQPSEIYNPDGTINKEKAEEKTKEIQEKLSKIQSVFSRNITAEQLIDPIERERLQHQVFGDYVKAHILNNTEDQLISRLSSWSNKSKDELALYGVEPEIKEDAQKWGNLAQTLVDEYNKLKDIKFAAPANETLSSYQAKTQAIKSIIFDYVSLKNMSDTLSQKYSDLKDKEDPFSLFPIHKLYNEKNLELIALKNQLEKAETPVEKQQIQDRIDALEKEQAERKANFIESKSDNLGFMYPKEANIQESSKKMADSLNKVAEYEWNRQDYKNASNTYSQLIKNYSDPKIGLKYYNDSVDYWAKAADNKTKKEEEVKQTQEAAKTTTEVKKEIEQLEEQKQQAISQEEVEKIEEKLDEKKTELAKVEEEVKDLPQAISEEEIDKDVEKPSNEQAFGVDEPKDESYSYMTPFKTYNKETRDVEGKPSHEIVLEHHYDHYLTEFVKTYAANPENYEAFVIADTEELLKQRLSKTQLSEYDASRFTLGAIVVFKEKGKSEFLKFTTKPNQPIVAFSFNEHAFDRDIQDRAFIKADKTKSSIEEVLKFYEKQQQDLEEIRSQVVLNPSLQIPIKAQLGSLGVLPTTGSFKENAFVRFEEYASPEVKTVKDENDYPGFLPGATLLEIPKGKTDTGLPFYIQLSVANLSSTNNNAINTRIHQAVQAIGYSKFDTKEEAAIIVQSFLKNLFYTNEKQYFKILKDNGKFKIVYFAQDKKGQSIQKPIATLKLKSLDALYQGNRKLAIYEKVDGKFVASEISQNDYKSFIHSNLDTNRKVLIIKKNKKEVIFTQPVNAYLNLSKVDGAQAIPVFNTIPTLMSPNASAQSIEDAKADIERRRQEELNNSIAKEQLDFFKNGFVISVAERQPYFMFDTKIAQKQYNFYKEINAKYDAELAALEQPKIKSNNDIIDMSSVFEEQNKKEVIPQNLDELIRQTQELLEQTKKSAELGIAKAITSQVVKIIEETSSRKIKELEDELVKLIKLKPKEEAKQNPLQQLRTEVAFNQPLPNQAQSTIIKANKKEFEIDFSNNRISSADEISEDDIEGLTTFFKKAHAFTFKELNINGKNVFLVKYNKIGKFVIFDDSYSPMPETEELLNNKEYQDFKDCK